MLYTVEEIFIVAAKRTPFGTFGGKFKNTTPLELSKVVCSSLLNSIKVKSSINSVIVGNVLPTSTQSVYLARHLTLSLGLPENIPSYVVNRLCGSGFQAIISACQEIVSEEANTVLCVGVESMSLAPFLVLNGRFGLTLGQTPKFEDLLWDAFTDTYVNMSMAITAENLASKYAITREECDRFAYQSQMKWKLANDSGIFKEEIVPVSIKSKGHAFIDVDTDEHPRSSTLELLAKLPPLFKKDGVVSAGNASGVCDGASAVIISTKEECLKNDWKPISRIISYHVSGCDPTIMGIGPVEAINKTLKKANLTLDDIDLIEINEAFAAQVLAVCKELGINPEEKLNVDGGAISIGHPLAASGTRIITHLSLQLKRRNARYGIGAACVGGGQGVAVLIENIPT